MHLPKRSVPQFVKRLAVVVFFAWLLFDFGAVEFLAQHLKRFLPFDNPWEVALFLGFLYLAAWYLLPPPPKD